MTDTPIIIDAATCKGCKRCIDACPFDALYMAGALAVLKPEACRACNACVKACPFQAIAAAPVGETDAARLAQYSGVWVYAEQHGGQVREVAYELLAKGRRLADDRGCPLSAVVLGYRVADSAPHLIAAGADKVYVVDQPELAEYDAGVYSDALCQLIARYKPEIILAGATAIGRGFFAQAAVRSGTGLTADCTALSIDARTALLHQTRPAFGGNIMATIVTPGHRPQMATVRPKVFKMGPPDAKRAGEVLRETLRLRAPGTRIARSERGAVRVNIADSEVIVAGGRGLKKAENLDLLRRLADRLGGVVGASRACVDAGWISAAHQVGQTGKTVCPKVYLAFGISGAVQHLEGMRTSDTIIAVNSDANAPIFNVADLGVVGDLFEIAPMLLRALETKQ